MEICASGLHGVFENIFVDLLCEFTHLLFAPQDLHFSVPEGLNCKFSEKLSMTLFKRLIRPAEQWHRLAWSLPSKIANFVTSLKGRTLAKLNTV